MRDTLKQLQDAVSLTKVISLFPKNNKVGFFFPSYSNFNETFRLLYLDHAARIQPALATLIMVMGKRNQLNLTFAFSRDIRLI